MNFKPINETEVLDYCEKEQDDKSIIISIFNSKSKEPHFNFANRSNKVMAILYLQVDEINLFSSENAQMIYDFVARNEDKVDTIIVYCENGIDYSFACCTAITEAFTGNNSNVCYTNMVIYTEILKCFTKNNCMDIKLYK